MRNLLLNQEAGSPTFPVSPKLLRRAIKQGMDKKLILQAATLQAARLIGEDRIGTLKKGAWADIIAVPGNPLEDLTAQEHVAFIMKNGEVHKPIK